MSTMSSQSAPRTALDPPSSRCTGAAARRLLVEGSEERRPMFFCLNDTNVPSVDWGAYVADILGTLFPTPSRRERA